MSTHTITLGSAFKVDAPVDGNVRNYTDANGGHWLGHDTHDVIYVCSHLCLTQVVDGIDGSILTDTLSGSFVRLDTVRTGEPTFDGGVMVYADTVDIGTAYDSYPDYDVHCGGCEELIHEGTEG